jgi:nitroreductase
MELMDAIRKRCSVRSYEERPIDDATIMALLEAARLSPSARNRQHRKFIVIENPAKDPAMIEACNGQNWIGTAPLLIAGVADPTVTNWADVDVAIAFEHIVLEAVECGLGSCWVGAFKEDEVKRLLGVPDDKRIVALLTVGYPKGDHSQKPKDPLDDMWSKEKYAW